VKPDLDVAATLECEPELLPYLPEILQDFDELGSDPQRLIECLEAECVADGIRNALDLCCGKGATSIALAKRFGMRVDGIDAIDAFLASARAQLEETRRRVEMSGAEIVAMRSSGSDARGHDSDMQRIVRRAAALVKRQPDLAALVARYVERQRGECAFLERWTRDVTWLLGKPPARETAR
jgi:SAM-dependent methyltransferase